MSDKERDTNRNNTSTDSVNDSYPYVKMSMSKRMSVPIEATSAQTLLEAAEGHMSARASTYDTEDGERSMGKAVQALNAITGHNLRESEGWLLLQLLKDVRQWSRPDYHPDSAEDCISYAALKGEALSRGD